MSKGTNNAMEGASEIAEAATERAQSIADTAAAGTSGVVGNVRHAVASAGRAVEDGYHRLAEGARDSFEYSRDHMRRWEHDVEDQIRARPVSSVLVSLGVGMILGFILRDRLK